MSLSPDPECCANAVACCGPDQVSIGADLLSSLAALLFVFLCHGLDLAEAFLILALQIYGEQIPFSVDPT